MFYPNLLEDDLLEAVEWPEVVATEAAVDDFRALVKHIVASSANFDGTDLLIWIPSRMASCATTTARRGLEGG